MMATPSGPPLKMISNSVSSDASLGLAELTGLACPPTAGACAMVVEAIEVPRIAQLAMQLRAITQTFFRLICVDSIQVPIIWIDVPRVLGRRFF